MCALVYCNPHAKLHALQEHVSTGHESDSRDAGKEGSYTSKCLLCRCGAGEGGDHKGSAEENPVAKINRSHMGSMAACKSLFMVMVRPSSRRPGPITSPTVRLLHTFIMQSNTRLQGAVLLILCFSRPENEMLWVMLQDMICGCECVTVCVKIWMCFIFSRCTCMQNTLPPRML